jgi:hypothetical protein
MRAGSQIAFWSLGRWLSRDSADRLPAAAAHAHDAAQTAAPAERGSGPDAGAAGLLNSLQDWGASMTRRWDTGSHGDQRHIALDRHASLSAAQRSPRRLAGCPAERHVTPNVPPLRRRGSSHWGEDAHAPGVEEDEILHVGPRQGVVWYLRDGRVRARAGPHRLAAPIIFVFAECLIIIFPECLIPKRD